MIKIGLHDAPFQGMKPCKKKPIAVHAIQMNEAFSIETLEGTSLAGKKGDYLMMGIKGEYYPCDKEIFEETYDWLPSYLCDE